MTSPSPRERITQAVQSALGVKSSRAVLEIGKLSPAVFEFAEMVSNSQADARSLRISLRDLETTLARALTPVGRVNRRVPTEWQGLQSRADADMGSWAGRILAIRDEVALELHRLDSRGGRDQKAGVFLTSLSISGALYRAEVPKAKHPRVIRACFSAIGRTEGEANSAIKRLQMR